MRGGVNNMLPLGCEPRAMQQYNAGVLLNRTAVNIAGSFPEGKKGIRYLLIDGARRICYQKFPYYSVTKHFCLS
jgi:hypothetical protein